MSKSREEKDKALADLRALDEANGFYDEAPETFDNAVAYLENKYAGLTFDYVGGYVPIQADGLYNGKRFYFRFRGDTVSLSIGDDEGQENLPANPVKHSINNYTGDEYAGTFNEKEFQTAFDILFQKFL